MTIIYPIIIRGRKGKTRGVRAILRISKGSAPQITNPLQPIYRSYLPAPTAELVTLNVQPQQVIHQRTATPILIQNANGQLIQAQKAFLNGKEVIIAPQPQQPQQIIQVVPSPNSHQPLQQPEIAMSTHSAHSNPPAYAPVNASAPPAYNQAAYNPDYVDEPALEGEGGGGGDGGAPASTREYYHE
eukprot:CAMPEP_0201571124 /NCGR_PEP_ID=MMETSP0190_2-20130828/13741_1 /ASSEMBLY_ACC=CAM_ASM_000263 /TAXON_ID=37353 /ORGANISM="Rosalina sp." /LENGTH=185 /DNA_ID=CAMNT_0047995441 /DNA_START=517 /DNA_END=1074 /DNA_ORIENTATION=+